MQYQRFIFFNLVFLSHPLNLFVDVLNAVPKLVVDLHVDQAVSFVLGVFGSLRKIAPE